jgi:outer membrane protein
MRAGTFLWAVLALVGSLGVAGASSLDHAGRLLAANDAAGARAAVAEFTVSSPEEEAEALWIVALSHMREDAPRLALPHLERLVTLAPEVTRFRLELARALFLVEQDERAQFHFESALAGQLSLPEIQAVTQYLDAMEKRKSWQVHVNVALVPQTNPTRASNEAQVLIGNALPVPLAQARKDMGLDLGLGATWQPVLDGDLRGRVHLMASGNLFRDSALNRYHLGLELGVLHLGDRMAQVGAGIAVQAGFGDSGRIMHGVGLYATLQHRLGEQTLLRGRISIDQLVYRDVPQMDGLRVALAVEGQHVLTPDMRLEGTVHLSHHAAQADFNRRTDIRLRGGMRYSLPGGMSVGVNGTLAHTAYGAPNPLLPQYGAARDTHLGVSATFLHRDWTIRGFAPVLEIGAERQFSNIPMRRYSNIRATVGASRSF